MSSHLRTCAPADLRTCVQLFDVFFVR